jgi:hypothetical protein
MYIYVQVGRVPWPCASLTCPSKLTARRIVWRYRCLEQLKGVKLHTRAAGKKLPAPQPRQGNVPNDIPVLAPAVALARVLVLPQSLR